MCAHVSACAVLRAISFRTTPSHTSLFIHNSSEAHLSDSNTNNKCRAYIKSSHLCERAEANLQ